MSGNHVSGIGGIFFRAADPKALSAWYRTHLGIDPVNSVWMQEGGPTVFEPFPEDTDYFGDRSRQWMINFRVRDLDGLLNALRAAGIAVETRAGWDDPQVGRFARIHDPEANPIELWEPAAVAGSS